MCEGPVHGSGTLMIEAFLAAIALFAAATLILAALILFRLARIVAQEPLTKDVMLQLLRGETDLLKRAAEDQARGVRGEVCENLRGFQETTVKSFGVLSDSANTQIRSFGERLDAGIKVVEQRVHGLSEKLNTDLAQMGTEAAKNRDALRQQIETKLDAAGDKQA